MTSRVLSACSARLAATTDDTQTVRVLAAADLPKENAFYYAHLDSAERLTPALREVNWQVLEDLAAAGDDVDPALIISALRQAARRDEHEWPSPARSARPATGDRLAQGAGKETGPAPTPTPGAGPEPHNRRRPVAGSGRVRAAAADQRPGSLPPPPANRVRARDVPAFVNKICEEAEDHPDAEFEISWRIVEP